MSTTIAGATSCLGVSSLTIWRFLSPPKCDGESTCVPRCSDALKVRLDVELGFFRVLPCRESHRRKEHWRRRAYLLSQIQNPAGRYPYLRQSAARYRQNA